MQTFFLVVHVLAAIFLIAVILIQRGRGGGFIESMSGMESMLGTKTNQFLARVTATLAIVFLCTSVILALIAARQTRSLIDESTIGSEVGQEEAVPIAQEPAKE